MNKYFIFIVFLISTSCIKAQKWPVGNGEQQPVIGTFGEYKKEHLNQGIDIYAIQGTPVYAVKTGGFTNKGNGIVTVGKYWYENLQDIPEAPVYTWQGRFLIGYVNEKNFLHLRESTTEILAESKEWINPLRKDGGLEYSDENAPVINKAYIKEIEDGFGNVLFGKFTIVVDAYDPATWFGGIANHGIPCGIDFIKIKFKQNGKYLQIDDTKEYNDNADDNHVKINYFSGFITIKEPALSAMIFEEGTTMQKFVYTATNDPFENEINARPKYWNSRQKKGEDFNISAKLPVNSVFPDGPIEIEVTVADANGNTTSTIIKYPTEEKIYAPLHHIDIKTQDELLIWDINEKNLNAPYIVGGNSKTLKFSPFFKVISKNEPEGTIKVRNTIDYTENAAKFEGGFIKLITPIETTIGKLLGNVARKRGTKQNYINIKWQYKIGGADWTDAGISNLEVYNTQDPVVTYLIKKAKELYKNSQHSLYGIVHCNECGGSFPEPQIKEITIGGKLVTQITHESKSCFVVLYDNPAQASFHTNQSEENLLSLEILPNFYLSVFLADESQINCTDYITSTLEDLFKCTGGLPDEEYVTHLFDQVTECLNATSHTFVDLVSALTEQLNDGFFKDVKITINLANSDGEQATLRTTGTSEGEEEITLNLNYDVLTQNLIPQIQVSDNYLDEYTASLMQRARDNGLNVDDVSIDNYINVEQLRQQVITDLEASAEMPLDFLKDLNFKQRTVEYLKFWQVAQLNVKHIWSDSKLHGGLWRESTWAQGGENEKIPQYARIGSVLSGVSDAVIEEVMGIPDIIKMTYSVFSDGVELKKFLDLLNTDAMLALYENAKEYVNNLEGDQMIYGPVKLGSGYVFALVVGGG
ncbi:MAG: hypothetical protein JW922_09935 [Paludibacteraceae bacterium]|nr:hypothetical protein [Paludibacteraceae bacterium]